MYMYMGHWVAQSVEPLDFGPGYGLRVIRSNPMSSSAMGVEPA